MTYQSVREILENVRRFHRRLRREVEAAEQTIGDRRSDYLLESFRRGEREMDRALAQYENEGDSAVLDTWIQYVPTEDLERFLNESPMPTGEKPEDVVEWKQEFDKALAAFYRQLADQDSAPRVQEFFESLAAMVEQRIANEGWAARDEELAPDQSEDP